MHLNMVVLIKKEFYEHLRDEAVDVHSFAAFIIAKATEELDKIK